MKPSELAINPPSPCKDCDNRNLRCHIACMKYNAYRQEIDELAKLRRIDADIQEYACDAIRKNKKKRNDR